MEEKVKLDILDLGVCKIIYIKENCNLTLLKNLQIISKINKICGLSFVGRIAVPNSQMYFSQNNKTGLYAATT